MTLTFLLALGAGAGCAGDSTGGDDQPDPTGARLTIVGAEDVLLENEWETEIKVRYTDLEGQPLAGEIAFTIDGEPAGAFLSATTAVTDANGEATLVLTAGSAGETTFAVEADADDTEPVRWDVEVLEVALDVTGSYRVTSEFDLASGLPGTAGQVINTFIDMTDDPQDPATWVLDQLVANIDSGVVQDFINDARPALDLILNEVLLQATPDIVAKLVEMGDAFGQIARNFGTGSELRISTDVDAAFVAEHIMNELIFTIDGDSYPYPLADMGVSIPTAQVPFSYTANRFTLGTHEFPMSYGTILMVALEQIIIPLIDDNATDLESLLTGLVDCAAIGDAVSDYLGFGTSGLYEGGCLLGLEAAAGFVEDQILSLDSSAMVLGINGSARWIDSNDDHRVDVLQGGEWEGTMSYAGNPAPLGESTFRGERMLTEQ
jgi:hypothetical protein